MENSKSLSSRIDYIDCFRSFGIILMVMGHVSFGETFSVFIHAFHMPMFFWISGFLFKHKSKDELPFKIFILKKAKSLLVPYLVFGIAHFLFNIMLNIFGHDPIDITPLFHVLFINTTGMPICGALWFLTALFITDVIFFLIDRYITNKILVTVIVSIIAIFGNVAHIILPFTLPYAIGAGLVGVGLFYIGYLFSLYRENCILKRVLSLSWIPNIILGIVITVLIFINGEVNMREGTYAIIPLFWVNAVVATVVGLNFARLIYPLIEKNILGRWLTGIGKNSIVYVCLNQVIIYILSWILTKLLPLPTIAYKLVLLVLTLGILYVAEQVLTKTKMRCLIGKW